MPPSPRSRRRVAGVRAVALGLAVAAVASACGVDGETKAAPIPPTVCDGILPTEAVTALIPKGEVTVREEQRPTPKYPVLGCEVSSEAATFVGSVYPLNMAGTDVVQLPGATSSASAPLTAIGSEPLSLNGMAGPDDAWATRPCKIKTPTGEDLEIGILVRARVINEPTWDKRVQLADLVARLADGINRKADCAAPPPGAPAPMFPSPARTPLSDAPVCWGSVDPRLLGPSAAGALRGRWAVAQTPGGDPNKPGGYVQACDLFFDGKRVLSLTAAGGYIAPTAEIPGERARLTQRVDTPPPPLLLPGDNPNAAPATPPGTVVASVDGIRGKATDADYCKVAFRMSRQDGPQLPAEVKQVPVQDVFRAFVDRAQQGFACPVPANAEWKFG